MKKKLCVFFRKIKERWRNELDRSEKQKNDCTHITDHSDHYSTMFFNELEFVFIEQTRVCFYSNEQEFVFI